MGWCLSVLAVVCGLAVSAAEFPEIHSHPRLHANRQEFERLKMRMASDAFVRQMANRIRQDADSCLTVAMPRHGLTDGKRMLSTSQAVFRRVSTLAMAFRLFGDERYLRGAEAIMDAAVAMPDWNPSHFLDVAVMAYGVALGYDWLYDELDPAVRERIMRGLETHALDAGIARGLIETGFSNWSQVCPGGVSTAALAIYEHVPEKAGRYLSDVIAYMPKVMRMYRPHGSYPEGVGYWSFGTGYNVVLIANLESAFGTSFGLADQPCFRETMYYPELMTGPTGLCFNYSDCGATRSTTWVSWWFAKRYAVPEVVEPFERRACQRRLEDLGDDFSPLMLLYWFPPDGAPRGSLPLVWRSGGDLDLAVLRTSWADDARYVAFKGGQTVLPHGHMDGGSFVYEAKGVRWAWDMGSENYARVEHRIGETFWRYCEGSPRYRIFRLSADAHNVLILDGSPHCATGDVRVTSLAASPARAAELDLSPLYTNATRVVRRGVLTEAGLRIDDSVEGLRAGAPIKWQMMTKAVARVEGDRLVLSQDGRQLELVRRVPESASPWQIDEAPHGASWEAPNAEFRRVSFTVPAQAEGVTLLSVDLR